MDDINVKSEGMTAVQTRRQQRAIRAKATSGPHSYNIGSDYESPDECDNENKQITDMSIENAETSENLQNRDIELVKEEQILAVEGDTKRDQGLIHTKSLPPEKKITINFAQRKCDDLSRKLAAAEIAKSELQEKILDLEMNRDMLIDEAKDNQTENDRLDSSLLALENTCKNLTSKNERINNSLSQVREDLAAEQRDKRALKRQIQDLEEERKRLKEANHVLQGKHGPCKSEIAQLRSQRDGYYTEGTGYLHQRNELKRNVATLTADIDALKLDVQNAKRNLQESELALTNLARSESKLRDAARVWKDKYIKTSQENEDLIKHGSELAEQNSALRHEHSVVDDSMLRASLASLNYDIRDWCDQIVEAKPAEKPAYLSNPSFSDHEFLLTDLGDKDLNVLIACVWEWLLKLVLGSEILPDGQVRHPDLWTDNSISSCLNEIENRLASKDHSTAVHWRHRTVQQISRVGLCNDDQRIEEVVDKIFHWVTKCFHLVGPSEQFQDLRRNFRDQVVQKAVAFALDLRRQDSVISVNIPQTVGQALKCVPFLMGIRPSGLDYTLLKVCITPQLRRHNFGSAGPEASGNIIVEAVSVSIPVRHLKPTGLQPIWQPEQVQDQSALDIDID